MKKYSCETHIEHALDMHVAETGDFLMTVTDMDMKAVNMSLKQ